MTKLVEDIKKIKNHLFHSVKFNIYDDNYETIKTILSEYPFLINCIDLDNNTLLHQASINNYCVKPIKLLLKKGATIDAENNLGRIPLHHAALVGDSKITQLLLKHGSHLVDNLDRYKNTPLFYAASRNYIKTMKILLANGADANAKCENGNTILYVAAHDNRTKAMKILLDNKANINAVNVVGKTALHIAVIEGQSEAIKLLLINEIDVSIKDNQSNTALQCIDWLFMYNQKDTKLFKLLCIRTGIIDESMLINKAYKKAEFKQIIDQALELKTLMQIIKNLFVKDNSKEINELKNGLADLYISKSENNLYENFCNYYEMAKGYFHYLLAKEIKQITKTGAKELQNLLNIVYRNMEKTEIFELISYKDSNDKITTLNEHLYQGSKLEHASICLANNYSSKVNYTVLSLQTLAIMQISKLLENKQITEEEMKDKLPLDVLNKITDFENTITYIGDIALEATENQIT